MPEKTLSVTEWALSDNFSASSPPFDQSSVLTDAESVVGFSFINKDPMLLVTCVMRRLGYEGYQPGIVDFLLKNEGEPNIYQKDLAYAMWLGQVLHLIEEILAIRAVFYQQLVDHAKRERDLLKDFRYQALGAIAPPLPPLDELDSLLLTSTKQLRELLQQQQSINEQREKAIQEFEDEFDQIKSKLEQAFQGESPEKLKEFQERFTEFVIQQETTAIRRASDKEKAYSFISRGITPERVALYDIYLRWQVEEAVRKKESQLPLSEEETKAIQQAKDHDLLTVNADGHDVVIDRVTADEKLFFQQKKREGVTATNLNFQEYALFKRLERMGLLPLFDLEVTQKSLGQEKPSRHAAKAAETATGKPSDSKVPPPPPPAKKTDLRKTLTQVGSLVAIVAMMRSSGRNVRELVGIVEKGALGDQIMAAGHRLESMEEKLSKEQKTIEQEALRIQRKTLAIRDDLDQRMQGSAVTDYTENVRSLREVLDRQEGAQEQAGRTPSPDAQSGRT